MAVAVERTHMDWTGAAVEPTSEAPMEPDYVDSTPQEVTELARQAFAAGLVTGPEAFQLVSQAYSEREVHGVEELAANLGRHALSRTTSIASSPTAAFRQVVEPVRPVRRTRM